MRDSASKKAKFCEYLDNIADSAWSDGKGFYLQGDFNAWLGSEVIPCDPNIQNENGKLFHNFLNRHPDLTVVNSLPVCRGLITRKRNLLNGKKEQSIIDFVVVCSRVLPFITEMVIDEANKYITTNYTQSKNNVKAVNSDHNTEFVKMNIHVIPHREEKREIYNLKNVKCQKAFKIGTEKAQEFSSCLKGRTSISAKCDQWRHTLDSHIRKTFRKIKIKKNRLKQSAADALIDKRNSMKKSHNKDSHELVALDAEIATMLLKEEIDKAQHFV